MSALDKDPAKTLARIALDPGHTYDSDMLEAALAYCWDQLCWRRTEGQLLALRAGLCLDDEATSPSASIGGS